MSRRRGMTLAGATALGLLGCASAPGVNEADADGVADAVRTVAPVPRSVGMNAAAPDQAGVYSLARAVRPDDMRVAVASRSETGDLHWLKADQFSYDAVRSLIRLDAGIEVGDGRYLFVSATPVRENEFLFHRALDGEEVRVVLGDRLLEPGTGFRVDAQAGKVTILDPGFARAGRKYWVGAGNTSVGNFSDAALLARLLER